MSRIISNCPVKKLFNINLNTDGVLKRTNDCPGQPEEPELNPKTALFPKILFKVWVK